MINLSLKKQNISAYIFVAALFVAGLMLFGLNGKYRKEIAAREKDIATHKKEISILEQRLTAIANTKTILQKALIGSVRTKKRYELSFQHEAARRAAIEEQLGTALSEISSAKTQIADLQKNNAAFQKDINGLQQEKSSLSDQVNSLKKIQDALQRKIKRILTKADVELGQVVVTPGNIHGKILKANRPYNFIIVDLGKNDGIKPKTALIAYRDSNPIGEITVEKVYDELSVAKAAFQWNGDELMVGDMIRGKE